MEGDWVEEAEKTLHEGGVGREEVFVFGVVDLPIDRESKMLDSKRAEESRKVEFGDDGASQVVSRELESEGLDEGEGSDWSVVPELEVGDRPLW